jgi:hypothetical protein
MTLSEAIRQSYIAQSAATRGGKVAEFVMIEPRIKVTVPQPLTSSEPARKSGEDLSHE